MSDSHFKLDEKQIAELHSFAQNSNFTAIGRLANYYYFIEQDNNKTADVYRQYKEINANVKLALFYFLENHHSVHREKNEVVIILEELANAGNIQAQHSLERLYKSGEISAYTSEVFVEQNLTKANYWAKVAECNKQGKSTQECQEIKGE
jgi:TPR repeat protein